MVVPTLPPRPVQVPAGLRPDVGAPRAALGGHAVRLLLLLLPDERAAAAGRGARLPGDRHGPLRRAVGPRDPDPRHAGPRAAPQPAGQLIGRGKNE